jgi:hypothetical protein
MNYTELNASREANGCPPAQKYPSILIVVFVVVVFKV